MVGDGLLERETELALIADVLGSAQAGGGGLALVTGAAGMGKSALLDRARAMAVERGLRVVRCRGVELEHEYAFGVIRQMYEPLLVRASAEQRQEWLSGAAGDAEPVVTQQLEQVEPGEFSQLHSLYWLTVNLCGDRGLLMLVDDLHWADEASVRFLAFLLPRLEGVPLAVVAATRSVDPGAAGHLIGLISTDPACRVATLAPLSERAAADVIERSSGRPAEPEFVRASYQTTGGNPLLLTDLARALRTDADPERAIGRRVSIELRRLSGPSRALAEALAVLAPRAGIDRALRVAGIEQGAVGQAVAELTAARLIRPAEDDGVSRAYEFVHPLVQQAVYEEIDAAQVAELHSCAARLLQASGARPYEVAAHLLRLEPAGDPARVAVFREAARSLMRSSAAAAFTYLRRAVYEPPPEDARAAVLAEAGLAAMNVHLDSGVDFLTQALARISDVHEAGCLSIWLGTALLHTRRPDEATAVWTRALAALPPADDDLRRELHANLLSVATLVPGRADLLDPLPSLRELPPSDTVGALLLDCMIAVIDALQAEPRGLDRAKTAVADPRLIELAGRGAPLASAAYYTLAMGDLDAGIAAQSDAIAQARAHGSITAQILHIHYRGRALLGRGDLAEAEADLREALRLVELIELEFARPHISALLADTLMAQGDTAQAAEVIRRFGDATDDPHVQLSRSRVLNAGDRHQEALACALSAGRLFAGVNPAILPWRSRAALSLYALARTREAHAYAMEEVGLATRWGAPHALGHALRVAGLVSPGAERIELLQEAVKVLGPSPARLAYAQALVDLGATLRHTPTARTRARHHLMEGMELAHRCGGTALVELARAELLATGARPRRLTRTGPDALTPSERRVAELAARGLSNREIAQQLYVTAKTVEVHLGNVYRKLQIARRDQLAAQLG